MVSYIRLMENYSDNNNSIVLIEKWLRLIGAGYRLRFLNNGQLEKTTLPRKMSRIHYIQDLKRAQCLEISSV